MNKQEINELTQKLKTEADKVWDRPNLIPVCHQDGERFVISGQESLVLHCRECGNVVTISVPSGVPAQSVKIKECGGCGRYYGNTGWTPLDEPLYCIPEEVKSSKFREENQFSIFVILSYDVRTEELVMAEGECKLSLASSLTSDQKAELLSARDDSLWDRHRKTEVELSRLYRFDQHRLQQFMPAWNQGYQWSTLSLSAPEKLDGWESEYYCPFSNPLYPVVLGDPEVLETLRRHRYPVDKSPKKFLQYLSNTGDGKASASSRARRRAKKEQKKEKEHLLQIVKNERFDDAQLSQLVKDNVFAWTCLSSNQGAKKALYFCPETQECITVKAADWRKYPDSSWLNLQTFEIDCPVCGKRHTAAVVTADAPQRELQTIVAAKKCPDGTFLAHSITMGIDPAEQNINQKIKVQRYLMLALGEKTFARVDALNDFADHIHSDMNWTSPYRIQSVCWATPLEGIWNMLDTSNGGWLNLHKLASNGYFDKSFFSLMESKEAAFLMSVLHNTYPSSGFVDRTYDYPPLARLTEAGWYKTYATYCDKTKQYETKDLSLAEMLDVSENLLAVITPEKYDEDAGGYSTKRRKAELLCHLFHPSDKAEMESLRALLTLPSLDSDFEEDMENMGITADRLLAYSKQQGKRGFRPAFTRYAHALRAIGLKPEDDVARCPDNLQTAARVAEDILLTQKPFSRLVSMDLLRLRPEQCNGISVVPVQDSRNYVLDCVRMQSKLTEEERGAVRSGLVLKLYDQGLCDGIAHTRCVGLAYVNMAGAHDTIVSVHFAQNADKAKLRAALHAYAVKFGLDDRAPT